MPRMPTCRSAASRLRLPRDAGRVPAWLSAGSSSRCGRRRASPCPGLWVSNRGQAVRRVDGLPSTATMMSPSLRPALSPDRPRRPTECWSLAGTDPGAMVPPRFWSLASCRQLPGRPPEPGPRDRLTRQSLLMIGFCEIDRKREPDVLGTAGFGGVDADDQPLRVHQRAAGVAGVDGGVRLDEVIQRRATRAGVVGNVDRAVQAADDASVTEPGNSPSGLPMASTVCPTWTSAEFPGLLRAGRSVDLHEGEVRIGVDAFTVP